MTDFLAIMALPFLACLIFTGIHAYLGYHVIQREIIFVDLAIAQIAVLGSGVALACGYGFESQQSYFFSLAFSLIGATLFAMTRMKKQIMPQEAIIGITYAVTAALLVMILSHSGEGDQHIREMLSGNILLVNWHDVIKIAVIYSLIGVFHWIFRRKFFLITENYNDAQKSGVRVRFWDFLFYASFGIVITSSVKIAGVLLVFSYLIAPPVIAILLTKNLRIRLILGWVVGFVVSVLGMTISYCLDYPTGASVVSAFGIALILVSIVKKLFSNQVGLKESVSDN